jgi:O-methyltransferase
VGTRERLRNRLHDWQALLLPEPYRTVFPYTMVGLPRLRKLHELAESIDDLGVLGDVVECGTCNGGTGAILASVACRSSYNRHVWLLDSFEGLPPAGEEDGAQAGDYTGFCCGHEDRVREVLRLCTVPDQAVTLVKGWFQDTLPKLSVSRIALLHIDADWYDSVRVVLEHLYDRVSPGGYVVFDDYGYWEGCRKACDELRATRHIRTPLVDVDGVGAYFQKPWNQKAH